MVKNNKNLLIKLILLISIIALISAFFIEYILGHQPCNLCILERIPYFLAIIVILLNYKFIEFEKFFILFLTIIFLLGALVMDKNVGSDNSTTTSSSSSSRELLKKYETNKGFDKYRNNDLKMNFSSNFGNRRRY